MNFTGEYSEDIGRGGTLVVRRDGWCLQEDERRRQGDWNWLALIRQLAKHAKQVCRLLPHLTTRKESYSATPVWLTGPLTLYPGVEPKHCHRLRPGVINAQLNLSSLMQSRDEACGYVTAVWCVRTA